MIFLSHNHKDKPVIEPIAIRLKEIFGQDKIFYDSWSIQPGDGIIDKMNQGLENPEFVFLFASENSLNSNMVKIEWQNALFKATQGQCKIIPIRVSDCNMPNVLLQNLYIDMFSLGIEATILNIINIIQGNNSFTPQYNQFSNLTYKITKNTNSQIDIIVSASHLMEPSVSFIVLTKNKSDEATLKINGGSPTVGGFEANIKLNNGKVFNGWAVTPMNVSAITPNIPLDITITSQKESVDVSFEGLLHKTGRDKYDPLPHKR